MKTVDQHNADAVKMIEQYRNQRRLAGVACNKCGTEMEFADNMILASNPPQKNVICPNPNCKEKGRIF